MLSCSILFCFFFTYLYFLWHVLHVLVLFFRVHSELVLVQQWEKVIKKFYYFQWGMEPRLVSTRCHATRMLITQSSLCYQVKNSFLHSKSDATQKTITVLFRLNNLSRCDSMVKSYHDHFL